MESLGDVGVYRILFVSSLRGRLSLCTPLDLNCNNISPLAKKVRPSLCRCDPLLTREASISQNVDLASVMQQEWCIVRYESSVNLSKNGGFE